MFLCTSVSDIRRALTLSLSAARGGEREGEEVLSIQAPIHAGLVPENSMVTKIIVHYADQATIQWIQCTFHALKKMTLMDALVDEDEVDIKPEIEVEWCFVGVGALNGKCMRAGKVIGLAYRNGSQEALETIRMHSDTLIQLKTNEYGLPPLPSLRELFLFGRVVDQKYSPLLESLTLSELGTVNMRKLKPLTKLKSLSVQFCDALEKIYIPPTVENLELYGCGIGPKKASVLALHLNNIRVLNIGGNKLGNNGALAILNGLNQDKVHALELENNNIGPKGCSGLKRLTRLKILNVSDNPIDSGILCIPTSVTDLTCTNVQLEKAPIPSCKFKYLRVDFYPSAIKAEELVLRYTPELSQINLDCFVLKTLDLSGNHIQKTEWYKLAWWIFQAKHLQVIRLQDCQMDDEAALILAPALRLCSSIRYMLAYDNPFGTKGTKALMDALVWHDVCLKIDDMDATHIQPLHVFLLAGLALGSNTTFLRWDGDNALVDRVSRFLV
jgi:Leucine-rich repeat (LRR) protein